LLEAAEKLLEKFQTRWEAGRFLDSYFDTLDAIARDFAKGGDSRPSAGACSLLAIIDTSEAWETIRHVAAAQTPSNGSLRARELLSGRGKRPGRPE
jgi:hypothetical protein